MNNDPSPVDNTAGAHDNIPAPGGAGNTAASKTPWYLSYVLWTNVAALLSMLLPSVRDWLASNPVEFTTALGAVNALLGFISRGTIQLTGQDGQSGQSTDPAGALPRLVVPTGEDATTPVEDRSQEPDQDPSSMSNSSESSPSLSGTSRLMIILGALMILLGGSCSSTDADPMATSVSLTDGQVVVIRGGSSLVVDRTERKLLWSQSAPEVVVAPIVQATSK